MRTEEISIAFILYGYVVIKRYSSGTGRFWQVSFLYAQIDKKTGRDRFSVYREKQDEEDIRERLFIKWEIMKIKSIL